MAEQPATTNESENQPAQERIARARSGYRSALLWFVALIVLVMIQWPMIKGWGYKMMGTPAPDDGIAWRSDYQSALAEARQSGKPVLLDFSASWCPPCQVMKHDVWPDPQVRKAVNDGFIPVAVDVDAVANQQVSSRYGISSIPAIVLVDGQGQVLKQGSFMSKSSLLSFLAAPKQG